MGESGTVLEDEKFVRMVIQFLQAGKVRARKVFDTSKRSESFVGVLLTKC